MGRALGHGPGVLRPLQARGMVLRAFGPPAPLLPLNLPGQSRERGACRSPLRGFVSGCSWGPCPEVHWEKGRGRGGAGGLWDPGQEGLALGHKPGSRRAGLQRGLRRPTSASPGRVAVCGGSSTLGGWRAFQGRAAASHLQPAEHIRSFPPFPSLSLPQPVSEHLSQIPAPPEKRVTVA